MPASSFGLGRRVPSVGLDRSARGVSLGGGRATVPSASSLALPRSVSVGGPPPSIPTVAPVRQSSPVTPTASSVIVDVPLLTTPAESTATLPLPASSITSPALPQLGASLSGANTPASVSSLNVETGSQSSERTELDNVTTPTSPTFDHSPLSSPIIEPGFAVPALDDSLSPLAPSKGPLLALRAGVPRTTSALSVSSMIVETGSLASEGVANLDELSVASVETPTGLEEKPIALDILDNALGAVSHAGAGTSEDGVDVSAEAETLRVKTTNEELKRYEAESDIDITASTSRPDAHSDTTPASGSQTPVLASFVSFVTAPVSPLESTPVTPSAAVPHTNDALTLPEGTSASVQSGVEVEPSAEEEGGYGDILDDFAADDTLATRTPHSTTASIPTVKCSDCVAEVEMTALPDHVCPATPVLAAPAHSVSSPLDTVAPVKSAELVSAAPQAKTVEVPASLDAFVPQTEHLVPEDVEEEEEQAQMGTQHRRILSDESYENPYDAYGLDSPTAPDSGLPQDVEASSPRTLPKSSSSSSKHEVLDTDDEDEAGGWATVVRKTH